MFYGGNVFSMFVRAQGHTCCILGSIDTTSVCLQELHKAALTVLDSDTILYSACELVVIRNCVTLDTMVVV